MKYINRFSFLFIFSISIINLSCNVTPVKNETAQLWQDCKLQKVVSFEIFNSAIIGYRKIGSIKKPNLLTIIDYSKPSSEKRFFVIDIQNKQLEYSSFVAHGKNSGDNFVTSFSNLPNSLQSSIGFFITAETYTGENGYSMKLDGLEKGINDNARSREIVIHGADYVSQEYITKYGRLGRSWGCPSLPREVSKEIIDIIANGSCLFIYGNDENYKKNSNFIN
jgi:hypothetical protein